MLIFAKNRFAIWHFLVLGKSLLLFVKSNLDGRLEIRLFPMQFWNFSIFPEVCKISFCWLWDFLQENHSFSSPNFGGFWTFLRHSSQCNFKFFRRWPIMAADIFTQPQPPQLPTALQVLWGCSSWASKNYAAQRVFRNCIVKWLIFLSNFCWLWDFYQRIWDL